MKKVAITALVAVAMFLGFGIGTACAQSTGIPVALVGDNVDLVKTLAPSEAANASATCGAVNVLKVTEAKTADGKPMSDLKGKAIHYLPTKAAEPVMLGDGFAGKKVKVTGKLYKNEATILVEAVEEAAAAGGAPAAAPAAGQPAAAPAQPGAQPAAPAGGKKGGDFDDIPVKSKSGLQVL
ncbi:MAG TPA: hypothetical protein PLI09_13230 [Candidatus Hydrogenedentes bacterium]|nr:hypothetical protein [Candidatus Hydrogenedentota bacterium]